MQVSNIENPKDLIDRFIAAELALPTPLVKLDLGVLGIKESYEVWIKRDDLCHPVLSGNKWRKLKYNLLSVLENNRKGIISFGGAHSNHLYALAGVRKYLNIPVTVLVRGDGFNESNETLAYANESGVELIYIDRSSYRLKEKSEEIHKFITSHHDYMLIPEGGSNELAILGVKELYEEVKSQVSDFDHLVCTMGTGGTSAALLDNLIDEESIIVYPALKGSWTKDEILAKSQNPINHGKLTVRGDYHFGGYAKSNASLEQFILKCKSELDLPLDRIYTAKAFYGLVEDLKNGYYTVGSRIVFLHSGGLRSLTKS
jgi:1-aminocyclopropane-1-carboxylate deaminase